MSDTNIQLPDGGRAYWIDDSPGALFLLVTSSTGTAAAYLTAADAQQLADWITRTYPIGTMSRQRQSEA